MESRSIPFEAFICPRSIAVIGATERPTTWGNWIFRRLLDHFQGELYPVNPAAATILGRRSYPDVRQIPGTVDLAIIAIPSSEVFESIRQCAEKGIQAGLIITSGFREATPKGGEEEQRLVAYARSKGLRLLGPNVSGIINLHHGMVAHPVEHSSFHKTNITFLSQGGYAITDIAIRECRNCRGFGKFIHTGNEADLSVVDFLQYCESDPETHAICIYIEDLKDTRRFLETCRRITPKKPIVAFKAGLSPDGMRAAASHTGAMGGSDKIYQGLLRQAGLIQVSNFELCLAVAHALVEQPVLEKPSIGITTMGGSWGVMLTDALSKRGLSVPELPGSLQSMMRGLGIPERASLRNPIDFGAAAGSLSLESRLKVAEMLIHSEIVGGIVAHGLGAAGSLSDDSLPYLRKRAEDDRRTILSLLELQARYRKPVLFATAMGPSESQVVQELTTEGIRFYHRLEDVADVLSALHRYGQVLLRGKETGPDGR